MIRFAIQDDVKDIYELICQLENNKLDYEKFEKVFNINLQDDRIYYLVYEKDNTAIGFLSLHIDYQLHHIGKIAEIMELVTKEEYRGLKIGKNLFQKSCEIAKENDCIQIELATNKLREKAHKFYEKEGMKNFHYKFSMNLNGKTQYENKIGSV